MAQTLLTDVSICSSAFDLAVTKAHHTMNERGNAFREDDEVDHLKHRCAALRNLVSRTLPPSKISLSCKQTLLRLVDAELRFLSRLSPHHPHPVASNLGYLESLARIALHRSVSRVSRLSKPVPSAPAPVHVDIVCTLRCDPAWFLVSDRNPRHVSWLAGPHGEKGLREKVERVVRAARSSLALKPASIVLVFSQGIGDEVARKLGDEFRAVEIGDFSDEHDDVVFEELEEGWVDVATPRKNAQVFEIKIGLECGDGERRLGNLEVGDEVCSGDDKFGSLISSMSLSGGDNVDVVNFDTTALVAMVSGISNGSADRLLKAPEAEMRKRFKSNYEFVIAQITSELQHPILGEFSAAIAGKRGIICVSVCSEFKELISMCGGPNEKSRAERLTKCLLIVPNSPSKRMMDLPTTRKMALKNKTVFGTGDYWRAPTLTANMGFVRAVSQSGMSLLTIEHSPRALTGD